MNSSSSGSCYTVQYTQKAMRTCDRQQKKAHYAWKSTHIPTTLQQELRCMNRTPCCKTTDTGCSTRMTQLGSEIGQHRHARQHMILKWPKCHDDVQHCKRDAEFSKRHTSDFNVRHCSKSADHTLMAQTQFKQSLSQSWTAKTKDSLQNFCLGCKQGCSLCQVTRKTDVKLLAYERRDGIDDQKASAFRDQNLLK